MYKKKFIAISDIGFIPSDKDLHKYATYLPEIKNVESNHLTKCSEDNQSMEYFTKQFLANYLNFSPKKSPARKIRQKRPEACLLKLKNCQPYKEKCENDALEKFKKKIRPQKTISQLERNSSARDFLSFLRKENHKNDAISATPEKVSLIEIESLRGDNDRPSKENKKKKSDIKLPVSYASPTASQMSQHRLVQLPEVLELKNPKTGVILNPTFTKENNLPFENYNPRELENMLGPGPYDVEKIENEMFVKVKDEENTVIPPHYDTNCAYIYPGKTFVIPCEELIKKGSMIQMVRGTKMTPVEIYCPKTKRRPKSIATIYIAYATFYIDHPNFWNERIIDRIIDEGNDHWLRCEKIHYKNPDGDFDIMNNLVDKEMKIRINLIVQNKIDSPPNLLKLLTLVLMTYVHIVFQHKDLYLLIMKKTENIFYIFDPNGRTCKANREVDCGKAAFVTVRSVEGIIEFLFYSSWNQYPANYLDEPYRIFTIGIHELKFGSKEYAGPYPHKERKRYSVVNKYFAIITGAIGVETPKDMHDENSSILTSLFALLYADIDPPKHWTPTTINSLVNYGGKYYIALLKSLNAESIHINDLPSKIILGSYSGEVNLTPYIETGLIETEICPNYRRSPLRLALLKYFRKNCFAHLQIDNSFFAIWKDEKFFYVFDPFERQKNGLALKKGQTEDNFVGGATLQIHINFDSMCRILYMNAIEIINSGYFYLHGFKLLKIDVLTSFKDRKSPSCENNNNERFDIMYPNKFDLKNATPQNKRAGATVPIEINVPIECLSKLSVAPCQRATSETAFMQTYSKTRKQQKLKNQLDVAYSIKSIPPEYRISDPDVEIITELVIGDILSLVDTEIDNIERKCHFTGIKAKAVLLKTDICHLNNVLKRIKLGDICDHIDDGVLSVDSYESSDSIKNTNFKTTLSGAVIICGESLSFGCTESEYRSMLMKGVTNAYGAIICATKYKISTWNSNIVNSAIRIGTEIQKRFNSENDTIDALVKNCYPDIEIGCHVISSNVKMLGVYDIERICLVFEKCFPIYNKLILLFATFNCAVVRSHKHFYLYFGIPCDEFGFQTTKPEGNTCLLRFDNLKTLVDRIVFDKVRNPFENFILIGIHSHKRVKEDCPVDEPEMSIEKQKFLIEQELNLQKRREEILNMKLGEIEDTKQKEIKRVQTFNELKAVECVNKTKCPCCPICPRKCSITIPKSLATPQKKHGLQAKKQNQITQSLPAHASTNDPFIQSHFGFEECSDGFFKVRGTTSLKNRSEANIKLVRACHFASVYAILQSIILPIHKWYPMIIDDIIEKSTKLYDRLANNQSIQKLRIITNLEIGDFKFDIRIVLIKECDNITRFDQVLCTSLKEHQYFMLQIENATFAVYYEDFLYLFDPYSSTEKLQNKRKGNKPKSSQNNNGPLNGASWIIFPNQEEFKKYIGSVTNNKKWFKCFNIYYIDIMKFKENKGMIKLGEFMKHPFKATNTNDFDPQDKYEWGNIKGENLNWTSPGIPIWSRNNKGNDALTKFCAPEKAFDVQIPDELYSLFGTLHPNATIFKNSRGKQYLAINVLACCIAHLYRVTEWNSYLLDTIVITGDRYFNESIRDIENPDFELTIEHLNTEFILGEYKFNINIQKHTCGIFFCNYSNSIFNLNKAMVYFFRNNNRYGILSICGRSIAFGLANKGYFVFDCQPFGQPLFETDQGASYCLLCDTLYRLLYCCVVALNVRKNIDFVIYNVNVEVGPNEGGKKPPEKKKSKKKKCK